MKLQKKKKKRNLKYSWKSKAIFGWKTFRSNEEVITAVDGYFADFPELHFRDEIHLLEGETTEKIELIYEQKNITFYY